MEWDVTSNTLWRGWAAITAFTTSVAVAARWIKPLDGVPFPQLVLVGRGDDRKLYEARGEYPRWAGTWVPGWTEIPGGGLTDHAPALAAFRRDAGNGTPIEGVHVVVRGVANGIAYQTCKQHVEQRLVVAPAASTDFGPEIEHGGHTRCTSRPRTAAVLPAHRAQELATCARPRARSTPGGSSAGASTSRRYRPGRTSSKAAGGGATSARVCGRADRIRCVWRRRPTRKLAAQPYALVRDFLGSGGQRDWRRCSKCQSLFYSGNRARTCPRGGPHSLSGSPNYSSVAERRDQSRTGTMALVQQVPGPVLRRCRGAIEQPRGVPVDRERHRRSSRRTRRTSRRSCRKPARIRSRRCWPRSATSPGRSPPRRRS